ncbi:helix-turn-helix domain-containing protein [Micromonospora sp. ATA32]|nr:helix-turn-helix domain-containing protein [Micromonospora sp. ATA32]
MHGSLLPPAPRGLAELPEAARAQALHRWRVLRPHLEDGVPLPRAAGEAGVVLRTAQRWLTRYRASTGWPGWLGRRAVTGAPGGCPTSCGC